MLSSSRIIESNGGNVSGDVPSFLLSGSVFMDNHKAPRNVWGADDAFLSPPECSGPLSVSFESEESSEDSEDYMSGLAEEIAQSMLVEEETAADEEAIKIGAWPKPAWVGPKDFSSPTSPQSTLAGFMCEAQRSQGSSGVSSPPIPHEFSGVDVLYCDLLRMKLQDQVYLTNQQRHTLSLQQQVVQRPSPCSGLCDAKRLHANAWHHSPRSASTTGKKGRSGESYVRTDNMLSLTIDSAMMGKQGRHQRSKGRIPEAISKQERAMWSGNAVADNGRKGAGGSVRRACRGGGEQQQPCLIASNSGGGGGSRKEAAGGLRAVFLEVPTSRECAGTGVFLPRRLDSSHRQFCKGQPACSTVLLPPHIVQVLNLNVEVTLPSSHQRGLLPLYQDHLYMPPTCHRPTAERSTCPSLRSHPANLQEIAPNISLPVEWTY